jgi:hypothetical protein
MIAGILISSGHRTTWVAALLASVIGGAILWQLQPLVRQLDSAVIAETPGWYFEMAVNLAWCGRYPYVTSNTPANLARINLMNVPVGQTGPKTVRSLIVGGAGSLSAYCGMQGEYSPVHESSMVAVESALLAVKRRITVEGVAYGLASIAAGGFLAFAFTLITLRWSLLFVAAVVASGLYLTVLLGGSALYSQYPLILPTTLCGIGVGALALAYGWHRHPLGFASIAGLLGVWAGFLGNLRTSHYPTALFIAVLFIAFATLEQRHAPAVSRRVLAASACGAIVALAVGVLAFDRIWIAPIRAAVGTNYSYHVIAHPLVLGLATPPSALASREDIQWNDRSGVVAARKVDPSVEYLGPGYERALFAYYVGLWKSSPVEMMAIYLRKLTVTRQHAEEFLSSARPGLFWARKDDRWLTIAAWPALRIAGMVGVAGLFAALLAIGCLRPRALDLDYPRGFCVAGIAIAGFLGFVESAVVLSGVVLWYSSVYVFALIFAGLFVYQSAVDACARPFMTAR